ncbi:MAG: hypothetical protein ACOVP3_00445 [Rhodoluna sp.]
MKPTRLPAKTPKAIGLVLFAAIALFGATYAVFASFEQPHERAELSGDSPQTSAAPCSLSFSDTSRESRTASMFGGVKVETGEVECNGENFIVSQTSNAAGDVLSIKKKRA